MNDKVKAIWHKVQCLLHSEVSECVNFTSRPMSENLGYYKLGIFYNIIISLITVDKGKKSKCITLI